MSRALCGCSSSQDAWCRGKISGLGCMLWKKVHLGAYRRRKGSVYLIPLSCCPLIAAAESFSPRQGKREKTNKNKNKTTNKQKALFAWSYTEVEGWSNKTFWGILSAPLYVRGHHICKGICTQMSPSVPGQTVLVVTKCRFNSLGYLARAL